MFSVGALAALTPSFAFASDADDKAAAAQHDVQSADREIPSVQAAISSANTQLLTVEQVRTALAAWGSFDLDDPFPLFAAVRAQAPVHRVTLADGHGAWLIVRYDEAKAAVVEPLTKSRIAVTGSPAAARIRSATPGARLSIA